MARQGAFHPGPIDPSVLVCQSTHRSRAVWTDVDYDAVVQYARYDMSARNRHGRDPRMIQHLRHAGFYGVSTIASMQVDHGLISALLERWRPEVHAFHMPFGEVGITLQDVEVLFGLRVTGYPVIVLQDRADPQYWQGLCTELLGFTPPIASIRGNKILSSAIPEVGELTVQSTDLEVEFAAQRLIFHLLGGFFFSETTKRDVKCSFLHIINNFEEGGTYSWGSAILSYLYRALCRGSNYNTATVCGCMVLLQLWAWERLPMVRPQGVLPVDSLGDLLLSARLVVLNTLIDLYLII